MVVEYLKLGQRRIWAERGLEALWKREWRIVRTGQGISRAGCDGTHYRRLRDVQ